MRTSPKSIARMSLNNNTISLADLRAQEREFFSRTDNHNCKKIPRNSFILRLTHKNSFIINSSSKDTTKSNNGRTKEKSTSEKSGKCEDGFEGRERRTKGVVFEDSSS